MDYTGTMRQGWGIVWKNKWLVLLTLLPTFLTSAGSLLVLVANPAMADPMATPKEVMAQSGSLLLLSCLSLLLYLVGMVLYLAGLAGQIAGVARLARGEATGFGPSFREGLRATPRLLGLGLLLYGIPILLFVVGLFAVLVPVSMLAFTGEMSQGDVAAASGMAGLILLCCLYALFLAVVIVAAAIYAFGARGIVLRKLGVFEALRHGWRVLRENLGQVILLALPFVLVFILLSILVYAVMFGWAIQNAANPLGLGANAPNPLPLLAYVLYLLPVIVVYAWQSSTFTVAYLKWTGKDVLGAGPMHDDPPSWAPPAKPPLV